MLVVHHVRQHFLSFRPLELETYEHVCSETLESLSDYYEQVVEDCPHLNDPDVSIGVKIQELLSLSFYLFFRFRMAY